MSNRVWLLTSILLILLSITTGSPWSAQEETPNVLVSLSPCGPSASEQPIPDDGRWLQICLLDPLAPEGTTVTQVHLKYVIEHPDPDQLEVRLSRENVEAVAALWERGKRARGAEFGRASDLETFHGVLSQGKWYLWIRDMTPGQSGTLKTASLVVEYAPAGPLPTLLSGTPGRPTSRRLPAGVVPS